MLFTDYISQNQAFTTAGMLGAVGNEPSARVALSRAVKAGRVLKVRTGLYISQSGRFQGVKADPHLVVTTLFPDTTFVYHSALELHGLAHSTSSLVHYMCNNPPAPFSFQGVVYKGLAVRPDAMTETMNSRAFGAVRVTTREQTLVDCMARVGLAGGLEEVVRSFAGLPYADVDAIMLCLKAYPPSVAARIGWYLDANQKRWSVTDHALAAIEQTLPVRASYKLDPTYRHFEDYASRWHLNLPQQAEEIRKWMEL
jgi:predicted transcriptional regulator of viral defense system